MTGLPFYSKDASTPTGYQDRDGLGERGGN